MSAMTCGEGDPGDREPCPLPTPLTRILKDLAETSPGTGFAFFKFFKDRFRHPPGRAAFQSNTKEPKANSRFGQNLLILAFYSPTNNREIGRCTISSSSSKSVYVWDHHQQELRDSGDLFYTWGYDIRRVGQWLRDNEYLLPTRASKPGV
jgi:hypothetical protein